MLYIKRAKYKAFLSSECIQSLCCMAYSWVSVTLLASELAMPYIVNWSDRSIKFAKEKKLCNLILWFWVLKWNGIKMTLCFSFKTNFTLKMSQNYMLPAAKNACWTVLVLQLMPQLGLLVNLCAGGVYSTRWVCTLERTMYMLLLSYSGSGAEQ